MYQHLGSWQHVATCGNMWQHVATCAHSKEHVAAFGWRYLSQATCLIQASFVECALGRVKDHHTLPHDSPLVKNACVRQVMLDKWLPLKHAWDLWPFCEKHVCPDPVRKPVKRERERERERFTVPQRKREASSPRPISDLSMTRSVSLEVSRQSLTLLSSTFPRRQDPEIFWSTSLFSDKSHAASREPRPLFITRSSDPMGNEPLPRRARANFGAAIRSLTTIM